MMTILFDEAEARGEARGEAIGEESGEKKLAALFSKLFDLGRGADAEKASKDETYRKQLLKEFNLS